MNERNRRENVERILLRYAPVNRQRVSGRGPERAVQPFDEIREVRVHTPHV
jgi:hypothetical protein